MSGVRAKLGDGVNSCVSDVSTVTNQFLQNRGYSISHRCHRVLSRRPRRSVVFLQCFNCLDLHLRDRRFVGRGHQAVDNVAVTRMLREQVSEKAGELGRTVGNFTELPASELQFIRYVGRNFHWSSDWATATGPAQSTPAAVLCEAGRWNCNTADYRTVCGLPERPAYSRRLYEGRRAVGPSANLTRLLRRRSFSPTRESPPESPATVLARL